MKEHNIECVTTVRQRINFIDYFCEYHRSFQDPYPNYICVHLKRKFMGLITEEELDTLIRDAPPMYIKFINSGQVTNDSSSYLYISLFLPELLDYCPEHLQPDGGWFPDTESRITILQEIKSKLLKQLEDEQNNTDITTPGKEVTGEDKGSRT